MRQVTVTLTGEEARMLRALDAVLIRIRRRAFVKKLALVVALEAVVLGAWAFGDQVLDLARAAFGP